MNILVTGGAGYIGSVLVPMLLQEGHNVTVLDRFIYSDSSLAFCCSNPGFKAYKVDVRDHSTVRPWLATHDAVIPLAALVGAPICELNPVDARLVNLDAPLNLLADLSREQIVVMPTTESIYGTAPGVCTEDTPYNPLSLYGKHKVEVEQALLDRDNSWSLRLATVFGMSPRMRLDLLINDFTWRAVKDRSISVFEAGYRRTSVHVRDVSRAFIHILDERSRPAPGPYNVGSVHCTKLELCESIQKQVPFFSFVVMDVPPKDAWGRDPDQRNYIVSDEKIRATGFAPEIDLSMGIAELLKGYRMLSNNRHGNMP